MQEWPRQVRRIDSRENYTHLLVLWLRRRSHGSTGHHVGSIGVGAYALGVEHIAALKSKLACSARHPPTRFLKIYKENL